MAGIKAEARLHTTVIPQRAELAVSPHRAHGESAEIFDLLQQGVDEGVPQALVTLVEVEGGSSRGIGAQMAVLADGRYCGYVSGGCVEAAVAAEAIRAVEGGHDIMLRFGVGSPFFDVKLPCGGSIELHVHVRPDPALIRAVRASLASRRAFALSLVPDRGSAQLIHGIVPGRRTSWDDSRFVRCYAPTTRLVLIGRDVEVEQMARIGAAAGLDIAAFCADDRSFNSITAQHIPAVRLTVPSEVPVLPLDAWTAVIFLFHDHDWEETLLRAALLSEAFFIGAMGSRRAQETRRQRLLAAGVSSAAVGRIKGPVGLFGPTRDATSLAVSILAEITDRRLHFDQL